MQNNYLPKKVKILSVIQEAPDTRTFVLGFKAEFIPGQFFMAGIPGLGESPISVSDMDNGIHLTIKQVGCLTKELCKLKKGDHLTLRGPLGNGFDLKALRNKDILIAAGGLGIAPLRPLINSILKERVKFKKITILYGARSPADIVFKKYLLKELPKQDLKLLLTVDNPDARWKHSTGVVTALLKKVSITAQDTSFILCGPSIMMRYTVYGLLEMGANPNEIFLSLERHMKCGIGKCGHCYTGEKFVCLDGPIFSYAELLKLKPEIEL